jgi:hypothetical protein
VLERLGQHALDLRHLRLLGAEARGGGQRQQRDGYATKLLPQVADRPIEHVVHELVRHRAAAAGGLQGLGRLLEEPDASLRQARGLLDAEGLAGPGRDPLLPLVAIHALSPPALR